MLLTDSSNRWNNTALLFLRITVPLAMIYYHGWDKITNPDSWEWLGSNMELVGLSFAAKFWGFMSAFAEVICSALILIGLFTRPAALILSINMLVATLVHLNTPCDDATGAGCNDEAHAIKVLAVAIFFVLAGAGKYSVDARLGKK